MAHHGSRMPTLFPATRTLEAWGKVRHVVVTEARAGASGLRAAGVGAVEGGTRQHRRGDGVANLEQLGWFVDAGPVVDGHDVVVGLGGFMAGNGGATCEARDRLGWFSPTGPWFWWRGTPAWVARR